MFAADELSIGVGFDVASPRLRRLIHRGVLRGVSEAAYEGGWRILFRVGPFGDTPGVSKLVRVGVLAPIVRGSTLSVPIRWEATGLAGDLFPVLDANLYLISEGVDQSRLALVGSYRPPLGRAGELLDRAILGHVAAATIRSFLNDVAAALVNPTPAPVQNGDASAQWRPAVEPGQP